MKAKLQLTGTKATKRVVFMHPDGESVDVLVRAITQLEEAEAIGFAKKFATEKGELQPDYGAALFDIALRAHIVATATLDPDSPEAARERFFPGVDYVLSEYAPDAVAFLHQHWMQWQEQCSPLTRVKSAAELKALVAKLAQEDDDFGFFSQLSPRTQASCLRFTAQLALSSPLFRSTDSLPTESAAAS